MVAEASAPVAAKKSKAEAVVALPSVDDSDEGDDFGPSKQPKRTDHFMHQTHNTQHTTHNTQHTTHNTQHTTHNTTHNTQQQNCSILDSLARALSLSLSLSLSSLSLSLSLSLSQRRLLPTPKPGFPVLAVGFIPPQIRRGASFSLLSPCDAALVASLWKLLLLSFFLTSAECLSGKPNASTGPFFI